MEDLGTYKKMFKELFDTQLKRAHLTLQKLCMIKIKQHNNCDSLDDIIAYECQLLRDYLRKNDRNISIEYILIIESELEKRGISKTDNASRKIRFLWKKIETEQGKSKCGALLEFETDDLLWVVNNRNVLTEIHPKYVVFLAYLHGLNHTEKGKILNIIRYIESNNALDMKQRESTIKFDYRFVEKDNYLIQDELVGIKEMEKFLSTFKLQKEKDEKKALIAEWINFRCMDVWDIELLELFIQYDSKFQAELSKEQALIMGVIMTFYYERKYAL